MYRIIICDDEDKSRLALEDCVREYAALRKNAEMEIVSFSDPNAVAAPEGACVFFLDVVMPDKTGLELSREISRINPSAKIVFCTNSREFAIEAFELRAFHYLIKPVDREKIFAILDEILAGSFRSGKISVAVKDGTEEISEDEVVCLEYVNHRMCCHLFDGGEVFSVTSRRPFPEQAAEFLKNGCFMRPHEAFYVNKAFVAKYQPGELMLANGQVIPVSKLRRAEVREAYMAYLSRRGRRDR